MSDKKLDPAAKRLKIQNNILGSEGISEVENRKQKLEQKNAASIDIDDETRDKFHKLISKGITFSIDFKDIAYFILLQLIPLWILGSAFFVPGIFFLLKGTSIDMRNFYLILIILGGLIYLYSLLRIAGVLSYKLELTEEELKWRNLFWWNTITNEEIEELKPIKSYYFYLTQIGGIIRFGTEVFQLKSKDKDYWLRAYPLRISKVDELACILQCWIEIK